MSRAVYGQPDGGRHVRSRTCANHVMAQNPHPRLNFIAPSARDIEVEKSTVPAAQSSSRTTRATLV
jgi:hypothetical protein